MNNLSDGKSEIEVTGHAIFSVIEGMHSYSKRGYEYLKKNGIQSLDQNNWYPLIFWLNTFKDILNDIGPITLKLIGVKQAERVPDNPRIKSLEDVFNELDKTYHMMHRVNGQIMYDPQTDKMVEGIGHYEVIKNDDSSAYMICSTPYPCVFDLGGCEGMLNRFKSKAHTFMHLTHDENFGCRDKGDTSCRYNIEWKKI